MTAVPVPAFEVTRACRFCASHTHLLSSYCSMKKPNKFNSSYKRRQKGKGQARQRAQQTIHQDSGSRQAGIDGVQSFDLISPLSSSRRRSWRDDGEPKRQLWERKQAELEARWVLAQSRQAEQDSARQRKRKIAYTVIGAALAGLVCIVAWYFAQRNIHIST
jgi:hypothetical protein